MKILHSVWHLFHLVLSADVHRSIDLFLENPNKQVYKLFIIKLSRKLRAKLA